MCLVSQGEYMKRVAIFCLLALFQFSILAGQAGVIIKLKGQVTLRDILLPIKQAAARNAIDCALWDYISKSTQQPVIALAGLPKLTPQTTAYTISLGSAETMARDTHKASDFSLLKIKLGGDGDAERMAAVREAAPKARLIADANEAWTPDTLAELLDIAAKNSYELIEQPLPEQSDEALSQIEHTVPICADESCHNEENLEALIGRYDAINIKLDKTGGFTSALKLAKRAQELNFQIMIGCMVGTSLSMAPALHLASFANWIDLDGPLLLKQDRSPGLHYNKSILSPSNKAVWG